MVSSLLLRSAVATAALAPSFFPPPAASASLTACSVPEQILEFTGGLRRTIARIRQGGPTRVLAIGSSSTEGVGASSPAHAYPAQLQRMLGERFPGVIFTITNAGLGGEIVAQTLHRLKIALRTTSPDLVIWQVGTNDAMTDVSPSDFIKSIREGVRIVVEHHADIILMDQQYTPHALGLRHYELYVEAVSKVAKALGVPLLRRFQAMEYWAGARPKPPEVLAADKLHMNDLGYTCIAELLAEAIERRAMAGS